MHDILIKGATIVDGSEKASLYKADIGIKNGKISDVGDLSRAKAERTINAKGLVAAPGFIDIQNHSDSYGSLLERPNLESLLYQGITTVLVGQCGSSLAPLLKGSLASIQKWTNILGINVNWLSVSEFFRELERKKTGVNVATLVGHATLRRDFVGDETRPLSAKEEKQIESLYKRSIKEGAFGISVGLEYSHDRMSDENELIELLKITAKQKGVASFHLRNEDKEIASALNEVIFMAKKASVRTKISHFKVKGEKDEEFAKHLLSIIEKAKKEGVEIYFDVYPYMVSAVVIYLLLPQWATEGGRDALIKKIKNKDLREEIKAEIAKKNYSYDKITVAMGTLDRTFVGRTVEELAQNQSSSPEDIILDLIVASEDQVIVFHDNLHEPLVRLFLKHPLAMIATDSSGWRADDAAKGNLTHPRSFGSTAQVLSKFVRKDKVITLENAVYKMSGLPAMFMGLKNRGQIKKDFYADLVLFDKNKIEDLATYEHPYRYPRGIPYVLINGEVAIDKGSYNGLREGKILKL